MKLQRSINRLWIEDLNKKKEIDECCCSDCGVHLGAMMTKIAARSAIGFR